MMIGVLLVLLFLPVAARAAPPELGIARVLHADREDGTARFETSVRPDAGGWLLVASAPTPYDPRIQDGDRVAVTRLRAAPGARRAGPQAQAAITPLQVRRTGAATPLVTGVRRTLIILVDYSDALNPIRTPAGAASQAAKMSAFFRAASYGTTTLPADIVGPYRIPAPSTGCNYWGIADQADAAAKAAGVDLSLYLAKVYALPLNTACGWAGLGTVGGNPSQAWINGNATGFRASVATHELGHGLGLYHSHACRTFATCASGERIEYGDTADVMGGGSFVMADFNAAQKAYLGWVLPRAVGAGTYQLKPLESTPDALRIERGDGTSVLVETRALFANWNRPDGVLVHLDRGRDDVFLLDGTPTTSSWSDPALLPPASLADPGAGHVTVTADAVSTAGATVTVATGLSPPKPPDPPIEPPVPPPGGTTEASTTFVVVKSGTPQPPFVVAAGAYECSRTIGGSSFLYIHQTRPTRTLLKQVATPNPTYTTGSDGVRRAQFTIRCVVTDKVVNLYLSGALKVTMLR